jgi:ADP-ribosylglycohydrolase
MQFASEKSVVGCLLGIAVGDAVGLCSEGLSPRRQQRFFSEVGHHLFFDKGMVSDDTEHACMVAQALLASGDDSQALVRDLARRLRWWLLGLPAGVGKATLQATIKLWLGFSPQRSGIFSAGNGPAMRSPLLGVCYGHNPDRLHDLVRLSTRLTHTDPKAEHGALAVAWAAHLSRRAPQQGFDPHEYLETLRSVLGTEESELLKLVGHAARSAAAGETTAAFAKSLGLSRGVTGYVYHTVPVVLHAWFRHPTDYRGGIEEIVRCGGDTDTTAAILGAIVGARVGKEGIPTHWLDGLWEWPRTVAWIAQLGRRLAEATAQGARGSVPRLGPGLILRNIFFLLVVLGHGFRRLLPPF